MHSDYSQQNQITISLQTAQIHPNIIQASQPQSQQGEKVPSAKQRSRGQYVNNNMISSQFGELKTDSKRVVQKIELNFEDMIYLGRKFRLKFFPWIRTNELKKQLLRQKYNDKHKQLAEQDIRLFCKNIELALQNKNPFDQYKIEHGSTIVIVKNCNQRNTENGVINPYRIFQHVPQPITDLILNVQSGLNAARKPRLAAEGTSGTYFLENNHKKVVAVYKPYDEQPYAPNNPRGYSAELGSPGIRKGVLSGECATREVAAYLLDQGFHGVPATTYAQFYHPGFNFRELCEGPIVSEKEAKLNKARTKHGSLQQFVQYNDVVGNLGSHQFQTAEVHKVGILDLRTLNCDRNEANILVIKKVISGAKGTAKTSTLVPIDHGLAFPDNFQIYEYQVVWMGYKQAQQPFSQAALLFIAAIDPLKDCQTLRNKLGFREVCLRNFRLAEIFLKKMAQAGFTLFQIGKCAYRGQDSEWSDSQEQEERKAVVSQLERLVMQAEYIYNTVKNNGIKSLAELQMGLFKTKKPEEGKQLTEIKQVGCQESPDEIGLVRKVSKIKETSAEQLEKRERRRHGRARNISLPNLKKKGSNRDTRRLKLLARKTSMKAHSKQKREQWGDLFFHYFEEIVGRFVAKKKELKDKNGNIRSPARSRLFSEDIDN